MTTRSGCRLAVRLEESGSRPAQGATIDPPTEPRGALHLNEIRSRELPCGGRIPALDEWTARVGRRRVFDLQLDAYRVGSANVHHPRPSRDVELHTAVDTNDT